MKIDFLQWFGGYFDCKGTVVLRFTKDDKIQPMIQIRGKKPVLEMIRKELALRKKLQFHRYSPSHSARVQHKAKGDYTIDLISKADICDFAQVVSLHTRLKAKQLALIASVFSTRNMEKLRKIQGEIKRLNGK